MKNKLIRLSDALQAVRESYIWDSEISQRTLEKKLAALPEAEITEKDIHSWCEQRCYVIISSSMYEDMYNRACNLGRRITNERD